MTGVSAVSMVIGLLDFSEASPLTVIIDGPSGSGKTTLVTELERLWPSGRHVEIVHMDDIYPGWSGLDEASHFVADKLMPGRVAGLGLDYPVWDWASGSYRNIRRVAASSDVIIEGCGALSRRSALASSCAIWVDEDDDVRKNRALSRAEEDFASHWDDWEQQFQVFVRRENPQALASLTVGLTR